MSVRPRSSAVVRSTDLSAHVPPLVPRGAMSSMCRDSASPQSRCIIPNASVSPPTWVLSASPGDKSRYSSGAYCCKTTGAHQISRRSQMWTSGSPCTLRHRRQSGRPTPRDWLPMESNALNYILPSKIESLLLRAISSPTQGRPRCASSPHLSPS